MPREENLHIVVFAAEAVPYVKVGGLADVVGALPKVIEKLGQKITLMLPGYKTIQFDRFDIRHFEPVPNFYVAMGPGYARADVYHTKLPGTEIEVFFLASTDYFNRDGVYDDPATKEGYPDNMKRYVFFGKAGVELMRRLGRPIDIVHCHDSHTGLIPGLLRTTWEADPFFRTTGILFTVHNLAYQGLYPRETLYWAGIDYKHFYPTSPFEFWGRVNFMKVGICFADLLSTVSKTYAMEIQSSPEFGYGLEGVLRARKDDLFGIMNGIDYAEWNLETDPLIPARYSVRDLSGKAVCKVELLKAFGLPIEKGSTPLIGIVSRLADQKGLDLVAEAMDEIASLDLQMVVLGTGQKKYHELFERLAALYPRKVAVKLIFDNALAHLVEAGADIFLMPSRYEPCGLNQLYSLRYGTVPVVRATGGLADSVLDYDPSNDTGTGFSFKNYLAQDMLSALKRALLVYSDTVVWRRLMLRGMSQDWSWERSAREYLLLYENIYALKH
jgi:starch synthase